MQNLKNISGYAIFILLVIIAATAAVFAFSNTGAGGIEERFQNAVGISGDDISGHEPEGVSGEPGGNILTDPGKEQGFFVEGSPVFYLLVLVLLAIGCFIAYRRFRI